MSRFVSVYRSVIRSNGCIIFSPSDSAKTALQTVAASEVAENLLDFDDEPAHEGPTRLAEVLQEPAAKSILSGTSTNPLDDPVLIFGNTSLSPSTLIPSAAVGAATPAIDPLGAFGAISPPAPSNSNQQEDLLGLF